MSVNAAKATRNLRHATIVLTDGTPVTPKTITLFGEAGDLTWTTQLADTKIVRDRGEIWHAAPGDAVPITGRFTIQFTEFIKQAADTDVTAYEFLTRTGGAAAYVKKNSGIDDWNIEVKVTIANAQMVPATDKDEIITFGKFIPQNVEFSEGDDANTLSFDFMDFETKPTIAKAT